MRYSIYTLSSFFFFNDTATTEIYTLSLHDALPICRGGPPRRRSRLGLYANQNGCDGNHCRSGAAKGAISPFSACFLRATVHVNSMICRQAARAFGGSCARGQIGRAHV